MLCCLRTGCLRLTNQVYFIHYNGLHISAKMCGTGDPVQNRRFKKHSKQYDDAWSKDLETWSDKNKMLYRPSKPGDPIRPAEIYHGRAYIRHSPKKMWYCQKTIRNMSVDEAIAQLGFLQFKAAKIIIEILKEAQELAVEEHNVEYKSNLHIAKSFVEPAGHRKMLKFHSRGYVHMNKTRFCHYYVMLREGQAKYKVQRTAYSAAVDHLDYLRNRQIRDGL